MVWKFDGSQWKELLKADPAGYIDFTVDENVPYLMMMDNATVTAVTYGASGMEIVGSGPVASGLSDILEAAIMVDDGDVYVGYVRDDGDSVYTTVKKHEEGTPGWSQLGDVIPDTKGYLHINASDEGIILTHKTDSTSQMKTWRLNGTNWEELPLDLQCLSIAAARFDVAEMDGKLYSVIIPNFGGKGSLRALEQAVPVSITLDWKNAADGSENLLDADPVTITATLTPAYGSDQPAGTVTFKDHDTVLAEGEVTIVDGKAEWTGSLDAIPHSLTVSYCGQGRFMASESDPFTDIDVQVAPMTGSGTESDPYIILTTGQLREAGTTTGKFYKLGKDLDFTYYFDDDTNSENGTGWMPVDFNGTIDGAGYKLKNLIINRMELDGVGIFRSLSGKAVNLHLEQAQIGGYSNVGGIAGYLTGIIERSSVVNAQILGTDTITGGMAGQASGYSDKTRIENSYVRGLVAGKENVGGFIGEVKGIGNPAVRYSYAAVNMTLLGGTYKGGVVGYNTGTFGPSFTSVFWDTDLSQAAQAIGSKGSVGAFGKTTDEMKTASTFSGWDTGIWQLEDGDYPNLKPVNSAPTVSGVTVSGTAQVGQTLTGSYTYEDEDGDAEGDSVYKWYTAEDAAGTGKTVIGGADGTTLALTADHLGKYIIFEVTPVASEGVSPGTAASSAAVGPVAAAPAPTPSPGSSESSSGSSPATEIISVEVKDGRNGSGAVVASAVIQRTTDANGRKTDEVNLTPEQADLTVRQLKEAGSQSAVIVIPDPNDEVAELNVKLPGASTTLLANEGIDLELSTNNVRIAIPGDSMKDFEEDIYFRVVPVKDEEERREIEQRAKTEQTVRLALGSDNAEVIGRPMVIETNLQSRPVTLVLPLGDAPLSEEELRDIGVFIEHSDGTKEFVKGEIVPYDDSGKRGIRISISKFSTFAIVYVEGWTERHKAYISGYPDGSFKPEKSITRAEMASILARTADKDFTVEAKPFSDVSASHWAYDAISKTVSMGLMQGYSDGTMKPDEAITRAEMAVIAAKLLGSGQAEVNGNAAAFSDLDNHWAKDVIAAASKAGILSGYEDGTFRPDRPLTRAEAVTILNKLLGRGPYTDAPPKWADVPRSHWAYGHIQEASVEHIAEE